ncbi:MAG: histidinol-phosphate transaminase, partial [Pseudomonadota bacterium]
MTSPVPNSSVLEIAAYVPGKSSVPAGVKLHKLSANETPLGPSRKARDAFAAMANRLEDYPDGSASALRQAIARVHGLNADNILCGNGSDEILSLIAQAYLSAGDEAIYTEHGFLMYKIAVLAAGGTPVVAPEVAETAQVDAILERVTERTKIVFLANPNNPTGTYVPINEVRRLHAGLPSDVILVLDAAYAEYVRKNDYESGVELVSSNGNVMMTRTFSKIHGLAALRVGWVYGPAEMIDVLNRARGPFNVNAAALAAAEAAIQDHAMVEAAIAHNDTWLAWTSARLEALGLRVTPSVGNFLLIHFDGVAVTAEAADKVLTER